MNESYILTLIGRIQRQANKRIEKALKDHQIEGIATSHGDILYQLYRHSSLTMQRLSQLIDRDKSTVTVLVNKLVKLGYVNKEQDAQDARVYRLSATEKGIALRPVFDKISEEVLSEVYRSFEPSERQELIRLLQKIKL